MFKRSARAAIAASVLLVSSLAAQSDESLTTADLSSLFPGTFQGVVHGLVEVKITASSNGRLQGEMAGETDRGRWRIRNGRLCLKWNDWTEGEYVCSEVTQQGDWFHAYSGGHIRFRKI